MQQTKNLTMYHLRKEKGQYISFGVILCLTAFIINIALVLVFQMDKAYDKTFTKLNTANINLCIPKSQDSELLRKKIGEMADVEVIESRSGILLNATAKDFRETEFAMNTVFYNIDETFELNQFEMIEKSEENFENAIFLPRYIAEFGEYELGGTITYQINEKEYTFQIAGILQEMQYGNYGSGLIGVYLSEECYNKLLEESEVYQVSTYAVKIKEGKDSTSVCREINQVLEEEQIKVHYSNTESQNKQTRTMVSDLVVMMLFVFAVIVLAVCLFLSRFRIRNMIQEDMVNLGVLKAIGYTGNTIIKTVVFPYLLTGGLASVLGVFLSYTVLGAMVQMLTLQSGFGFSISFDIVSGFVTMMVLLVIILLTTWSAAGKIKKLQPILAIRGGEEKEHSMKNYIPMDKIRGNIQILLILKRIFGQAKQNLLLFLVSFVMMGLIAFAGTLFYNVVIKPEHFLKTLSEETPDVIIKIKEESRNEIKNTLLKNQKVEQVLFYGTETIKLENDSTKVFVCEDFSKVKNDLCYEGRNPENENEIALGSAFSEKYQVDDLIEITSDSGTLTYKVVGFVQSVNYSGNVCELTEEGYYRIKGEGSLTSLYVYLSDDVNIENWIDEANNDYEMDILQAVNYVEMMEQTSDMYSGIVKIAVIAVMILTTLIIFLILYVIVKSIIVKSKQELGIYKAMGYSSRQLIFQTAGSFLPVIGGAAILSALLGCVYMPHINNLIFSMVGAMKNDCEVSIGILLLFALLQTGISFVLCIWLALPIRKISAYSLIKD
ncbi:MAG: FtsX-like permease family protein [Lachnospiraceae bacterium]|nr:FtsX-like permease family protein [Lachnospiraceae bacterium]